MDLEISKEKLDLFFLILRDLNTTVKNSSLYSSDHPIFSKSVKALKAQLDKWFANEEKIELGIAQDAFLLEGDYIEGKADYYKDLANYLHQRGMITISFIREIEVEELKEFLVFLNKDVKTIKQMGGVKKNISETTHIRIKEIDYSSLLEETEGEVITDEEKLWQFLSKESRVGADGILPEADLEFLKNLVNDPEKSVELLNNVYGESVSQLKGKDVAGKIIKIISQAFEYAGRESGENKERIKKSLMYIVSHLNPGFVAKLFEADSVEGKPFDFALELKKDYSDVSMSGFIGNVISSEEIINTDLIKIFDKLISGEERANIVASMVIDDLFEKNMLSNDIPSQLQLSIKEMFKVHPDSEFTAQIYKITNTAFVDSRVDPTHEMVSLSSEIKEFVKSIREERVQRDEAMLLLNIIWLEDNISEFDKMCGKLLDFVPVIMDLKDVECLRTIIEMFTEKMRPEQKKNKRIDTKAREVLSRLISRDSIDRVVSFIPVASEKNLDGIIKILLYAKKYPAVLLFDAFFFEGDISHRYKIGYVFAKVKKLMPDECIDQLGVKDPFRVVDLLKILRRANTENLHKITSRLIAHKHQQVRALAMEDYLPTTEEEINTVFKILKTDGNKDIQRKALNSLVRTKSKGIVNSLFKYVGRSIARRKHLLSLVELCGKLKVQESFPYLKSIFLRQTFFNPDWRDELRVQAVISLGRLGTAEAKELIKEGLKHKREKVRNMCGIIVKLDEDGKGTQSEKGIDENAA